MVSIIIDFLLAIGFFALAVLIERIYYSHIDKLPKDKRDELIKRQSQMKCRYCNSYDFEVIGMKRRKLMFQCKCCKRMY